MPGSCQYFGMPHFKWIPLHFASVFGSYPNVKCESSSGASTLDIGLLDFGASYSLILQREVRSSFLQSAWVWMHDLITSSAEWHLDSMCYLHKRLQQSTAHLQEEVTHLQSWHCHFIANTSIFSGNSDLLPFSDDRATDFMNTGLLKACTDLSRSFFCCLEYADLSSFLYKHKYCQNLVFE